MEKEIVLKTFLNRFEADLAKGNPIWSIENK